MKTTLERKSAEDNNWHFSFTKMNKFVYQNQEKIALKEAEEKNKIDNVKIDLIIVKKAKPPLERHGSILKNLYEPEWNGIY